MSRMVFAALIAVVAAPVSAQQYYARERIGAAVAQAAPAPAPVVAPVKTEVLNGGFESGAVSPWTGGGSIFTATVGSGRYSLFIPSSGSASQKLSTEARPYTVKVSCYANSGDSVKISWNGVLVGICGAGGSNAWSSTTKPVVGTGGSDTLTFSSPNTTGRAIDDVSITPA